MEAWDEEIEWCLTHNIEPADHIAALTRTPQNPLRLSPEQAECPHPLEAVTFNAYLQEFTCEQCGQAILIPDLAEGN